MNKYRLLLKTPLPQGLRLALQRSMMDADVDRARRKFRNERHFEEWWEHGSWDWEYLCQAEEEATFHTRQLRRRCQRLRIPMPPFHEGETSKLTEWWERSEVDGRHHLSLAGENKVRDAIREEERYRAESRARRLPWITALTGLAGSLAGLLAVLSKLF